MKYVMWCYKQLEQKFETIQKIQLQKGIVEQRLSTPSDVFCVLKLPPDWKRPMKCMYTESDCQAKKTSVITYIRIIVCLYSL